MAQECRVVPINSDPLPDLLAGQNIELSANSATVAVNIECAGWGAAELEAYCFIAWPWCPAIIWTLAEDCNTPAIQEKACQSGASCSSGECVNTVCTPVYAGGSANWVFNGLPTLTDYNPSTGEFCAASLETAPDDGLFHYFGTALIAVEGTCDVNRSFEISLSGATFYLGDGTTSTPSVTNATVSVDPAPDPPQNIVQAFCGSLGITVMIPLLGVLSLWRARRGVRRAPI